MSNPNPYNPNDPNNPNPAYDVDDLAARADRAVNDATPYAPPTADTGDDVDDLAGRERGQVEKTDDAPLLAGHGPGYDQSVEYDADAADDEVDLTDMPKLRSFAHELPSARFAMVAKGVDVIRLLPGDMLNDDAAASLADVDPNGDDFDMSQLDKVAAIADVVPAMEQFVLDMAADRDDMREWLISRGDVKTVMGAFNLAQAHVKN